MDMILAMLATAATIYASAHMPLVDVIILVIGCLLTGGLTRRIARSKHLPVTLWTYIGVFFGIFGLIAILLVPRRKPRDPMWAMLHPGAAP